MRHINSVIAKRKTVLTMANEKRLIDLSALGIGERNPNAFNNPERAYSWNDLLKILETALTVDAVEVVRCRDCIHAVEIEKDYISNGVRVQEWISVKERLPESEKESVLIALRWGEVDIGWCEDGRWRSEFVNEYEDGEVTHWMPLPPLPKGE